MQHCKYHGCFAFESVFMMIFSSSNCAAGGNAKETFPAAKKMQRTVRFSSFPTEETSKFLSTPLEGFFSHLTQFADQACSCLRRSELKEKNRSGRLHFSLPVGMSNAPRVKPGNLVLGKRWALRGYLAMTLQYSVTHKRSFHFLITISFRYILTPSLLKSANGKDIPVALYFFFQIC